MIKTWLLGSPARRWAAFGFALLLLVFSTKYGSTSASAAMARSSGIASTAAHPAKLLARGELSSIKVFAPEFGVGVLTSGPVVGEEDGSSNLLLKSVVQRDPSTDELGLLLGSNGVSQFRQSDCALACAEFAGKGSLYDPSPTSYGGAYGFGGTYGFGGAPYAGGYFLPQGGVAAGSATSDSSGSGGSDSPTSAREPSALLLLVLGLTGVAALAMRGKLFATRAS